MTLSPAYGRDYRSKAEIIKDFEAGKDFFVEGYGGSGYASIRDLPDGTYQLRYKQLRQVAVVKIKGGKLCK